ncbi:hypothetical protein HELRODRAFT_146525, partial [Helobdella robusta]|uniref:Ion transport domain-containing protein n=1 Tax=Helobdella robusta TaxID=6412 RepID=T1EJT0_HELRO
QICVYRMIEETIPFLCIMAVVWMAFTVTLFNLYHSYARMKAILPDGSEERSAQVYLSLLSSGSSVYWGFFGDAQSLAPRVQLPPIKLKVGHNVTTVFHQHSLTRVTGSILFAMFNLLGLVILMNMLVAIMSETYSIIVGQSINAWKFARTKV